MPLLTRLAPAATTPAPDDSGDQELVDQPTRPALAEVLDLQESDVPLTAHALKRFFPDV
ncbi:hypothetical protein LXH09_28345 [Streptomyces sp. CS7]|uniref:hypothetical protein n=1 Tax=Streptomyces sp. CS-7 TaxID=2906769 RepID=UPI0021B24733|nr:hypothetical protein [Streptomyces sp. CS-7]MCT6780559.1 hypothetical protein [Streptomyces sp. CS-7]